MDNPTAMLNNLVGESIGGRIVADGSVKLRIRCVAYPESTAHYADAVIVSATSAVFSLDGVADTSFSGGSGTLLFSAYTTLGALVDQINSSDNWEAEIVAGLRSDTINGSELLARSTSTFRMFEEVKLYADSSDNGVYGLDLILEPNKPFETVHGLLSQQSFLQHRVLLNRLRALVNTNAGEVIAVQVHEVKPDRAEVGDLLYQLDGTDNAEADSGQTDVMLVSAGYGNSLLVRLRSTGTGWVDATAYLDVQGKRE